MRTTTSGQTVTSISLATGRSWTDKNGQKQEKTEFHNLIIWRRLAEVAGQYLVKGQEAYFEGRLETRKYTGKDGQERRVTEVVVENMQMGSKPRGASFDASPNQPVASQGQSPKEEEIPTINLDEEQDEVKIEDVPF